MNLSGRRHRVEFKGIDQQIEDAKAERRAQQRREKKQSKEAKRMAAYASVRPFLYFLQTFTNDGTLRQEMENVDGTMAMVRVMFLHMIDDPEGAWQAFFQFVSTRKLPKGSKRLSSPSVYSCTYWAKQKQHSSVSGRDDDQSGLQRECGTSSSDCGETVPSGFSNRTGVQSTGCNQTAASIIQTTNERRANF
jgi:hypothetical protein